MCAYDDDDEYQIIMYRNIGIFIRSSFFFSSQSCGDKGVNKALKYTAQKERKEGKNLCNVDIKWKRKLINWY